MIKHDAKQTPAPEFVTAIDQANPNENDSSLAEGKSTASANQRVGIWTVTGQNRNDSLQIVVQNFSSAS